MIKASELIQSINTAANLFYKWLIFCTEMFKLAVMNAPNIWRKYPQSHYKIIFVYVFFMIPLWVGVCAGKLAERLDDALGEWIEK